MTDPTDSHEASADAVQPLPPEEEARLTEALLCAYRPTELDPDVNEALIEQALEDPLRPASEEERIESERFRRALDGHGEHPDLELVRGLVEAHRSGRSDPSGIADVSERAFERALASAPVRADGPARRTKGNVVFVSFGVMTALTAAAAVLLLVLFPSADRAPNAAAPAALAIQTPPLTQSRSSEALFDAKFERDHTTERVDRIASARARELRQNRFRQWGVAGP